MPTLKEYNSYGEDLERLLLLRTSPLAVKMLEKEEDIPEGVIRPTKDLGIHLAQCQTFAMSRRERAAVAMLKEDNWCPAPLIAYGLVERPQDQDPRTRQQMPYESLEYGKYIGIVTAPLRAATFEPDVVLIYSNTAQLRSLLLTMKNEERPLINSNFFPPSCAFAVSSVILTDQYWINLPDPGEYERALGGEDEMMFSVPRNKVEGLISDLRQAEENNRGYLHSNLMMRPDFPQPDFYKRIFQRWGLHLEN